MQYKIGQKVWVTIPMFGTNPPILKTTNIVEIEEKYIQTIEGHYRRSVVTNDKQVAHNRYVKYLQEFEDRLRKTANKVEKKIKKLARANAYSMFLAEKPSNKWLVKS